MKYRFICAIYFLGMEKDNMTIPLPSGKISNEKGLLKQMFDNNLSVGTRANASNFLPFNI